MCCSLRLCATTRQRNNTRKLGYKTNDNATEIHHADGADNTQTHRPLKTTHTGRARAIKHTHSKQVPATGLGGFRDLAWRIPVTRLPHRRGPQHPPPAGAHHAGLTQVVRARSNTHTASQSLLRDLADSETWLGGFQSLGFLIAVVRSIHPLLVRITPGLPPPKTAAPPAREGTPTDTE